MRCTTHVTCTRSLCNAPSRLRPCNGLHNSLPVRKSVVRQQFWAELRSTWHRFICISAWLWAIWCFLEWNLTVSFKWFRFVSAFLRPLLPSVESGIFFLAHLHINIVLSIGTAPALLLNPQFEKPMRKFFCAKCWFDEFGSPNDTTAKKWTAAQFV